MNRLRALTGTLAAFGIAAASQGCASVTDDGDNSEGAATVSTDAKVLICGDEVNGCNQCPEQIGSHPLSASERDACTLKSLRSGLDARVSALIAEAGRRGFFLRTAAPNSTTPFKLARIRVELQLGGGKSAASNYTELSGSFSAGDSNNAKAGVNVYSTYMPVKFGFEFIDTSGDHREPYYMEQTYGLVPFFKMDSELGINLNVGAILAKFGGGAIGSGLLSALGGNLSLQVAAKNGITWSTPICADRSDDGTDTVKKDKSTLAAFDRDFYKSVLTPACVQTAKDHPELNLNCKGLDNLDTRTRAAQDQVLVQNELRAVEACQLLDEHPVSPNTYKIAFAAPKEWGYAKGQKAFLYNRNANAADIWDRAVEVQILGSDSQKCGSHALKTPAAPADASPAPMIASSPPDPTSDEVCVYAQLTKPLLSWPFPCDTIGSSGTKEFAVAQLTKQDEDKRIQYRMP